MECTSLRIIESISQQFPLRPPGSSRLLLSEFHFQCKTLNTFFFLAIIQFICEESRTIGGFSMLTRFFALLCSQISRTVESLAYKTFKSPFVPGWLHLCVILGGDQLNKLQGLFFVTNVHFELHLELQLFFDLGLFQDLLLLYSVLEPFWKRINQETLFL